ncbi:hypothetical protein ACFRJ9_18410 [Paenarthrobacter sp. NPDC056912]|uniref:hypothetical protein n=1 Tax=Paenarthrobacter sp. NPDC056912 TaxID=3345965 RepID=UPI003670C6A7
MAIEFKESLTIKQVGTPESAAARLEAQLDRYFPIPEYDPKAFTLDSFDWRLRDSSGTRSLGETVAEVFQEFRDHNLKPSQLYHDRRLAPTRDGDRGPKVTIFFPFHKKAIYVDIAGTDRMAVDGAAVTCRRIKEAVEKRPDGSVDNVSESRSWLKRTWRDHTATFAVTLVAGVLVVAIALWLGLSPRP